MKATTDELKPETVNAFWNNLWNKAINCYNVFPGTDDGEVRKIIYRVRKVHVPK
jgi:hypothetical protein